MRLVVSLPSTVMCLLFPMLPPTRVPATASVMVRLVSAAPRTKFSTCVTPFRSVVAQPLSVKLSVSVSAPPSMLSAAVRFASKWKSSAWAVPVMWSFPAPA